MEEKITLKDEIVVKGVNEKGFGTVPQLIMRNPQIPYESKAIYAYLCSFAGAGSTAFPSRDMIAYELGISRNTLSKYMKQLCDIGCISVKQCKVGGRFSHNVYTIHNEVTVYQNLVHQNLVHQDLTPKINNNKNKQYMEKEKEKKEIKEKVLPPVSSVTESERKSPPNPLKESCENFLNEIFSGEFSEELSLLLPYLESRIEKDKYLTLTEFKSSILTLVEIVRDYETRFDTETMHKKLKQVILNASTGTYKIFKPLAEDKNKVKSGKDRCNKFGEVIKTEPKDSFDEDNLALDDKGNKIIF